MITAIAIVGMFFTGFVVGMFYKDFLEGFDEGVSDTPKCPPDSPFYTDEPCLLKNKADEAMLAEATARIAKPKPRSRVKADNFEKTPIKPKRISRKKAE